MRQVRRPPHQPKIIPGILLRQNGQKKGTKKLQTNTPHTQRKGTRRNKICVHFFHEKVNKKSSNIIATTRTIYACFILLAACFLRACLIVSLVKKKITPQNKNKKRFPFRREEGRPILLPLFLSV